MLLAPARAAAEPAQRRRSPPSSSRRRCRSRTSRGHGRLWRQRRTEWVISVVAFLGVALLGVLPGIAVAVVLSILNVFRRAWWPYQARLGQVDGLAGLHDVTRYESAQRARRSGRLPVRRPAVLRQRAHLPRGDTPDCATPTRRRAGSCWPPSRSPTSTRRPPTSCVAARRGAGRPWRSSSSSPSSRTRSRADPAVRAGASDRRGSLLPHARRRHRRLP